MGSPTAVPPPPPRMTPEPPSSRETSTLRQRRWQRRRRGRRGRTSEVTESRGGHVVTEVARLAATGEAEEEGTDERSVSELLWRRMEDNSETAFTFSSSSSSRSTSAAYKPSHCRKE